MSVTWVVIHTSLSNQLARSRASCCYGNSAGLTAWISQRLWISKLKVVTSCSVSHVVFVYKCFVYMKCVYFQIAMLFFVYKCFVYLICVQFCIRQGIVSTNVYSCMWSFPCSKVFTYLLIGLYIHKSLVFRWYKLLVLFTFEQ